MKDIHDIINGKKVQERKPERSKSGLMGRNSGDLTRQGHKHNGMIINHATNGKQGGWTT